MYIKKLSVKGYKRIFLSGIRSLIMTIENPYQVILGTNGSGKSSLLKELSPLPGDPKDYLKGGFKVIELDHEKSQYVLTSDYTGKGHHSFLKDDVEKNEGGTITIQRELVKQEFGITNEIHDLLMGRLRFTNMSPSKRREYITLMSDTDLTYAMGVYKKLAGITRDNQGTVKHLRQRITKETDSLNALQTQENLEQDVQRLQEELTVLMEQRRPDLPNHQTIQRRLGETLGRADELATKILTHPYREGDTHYGSLESLGEAVQTLKGQQRSKQELLNHQSTEHEKLKGIVGTLESNDVGSLDELTDRAAKLDARIAEQAKRMGGFQFDGSVDELEGEAKSLKEQLVDVLMALPDNSDRRFSRAKLEQVEESIRRLRSEVDGNASKARRCRQDIDHIQNTKEMQCPKCEYVWRPGVSEKDVEALQKNAQAYEKASEAAAKELTKAYEYREAIQNYAHHFGRLRALAASHPKAHSLFDYLMEDDRIYHEPSQHLPVIDRWLADLYAYGEWYRLTKERAMVEETLKKVKLLSESNVDHIGDTLNGLYRQIQETTDEVRKLKTELTALEKRYTHAQRAERWGEELTALYREIEADQQLMLECLKSDTLTTLLHGHQRDLAIKSQRLNEKASIEGIIKDLKRSLDEVEASHETHKLLCKALSPTDGVIAEQMTAFIRCMTEQMNEIIEQVYSYPFKIFPCGIESGDLDYKFPIVAGEDAVYADDVSFASEGQQEIIDFAFKLVATLYLGFTDYPLYLDELGSSQDETHLTNVMNYVKLLIDAHRHSQLFMISHYAAGHGSFTQADYLVLNGANITTPARHNQHVELTH